MSRPENFSNLPDEPRTTTRQITFVLASAAASLHLPKATRAVPNRGTIVVQKSAAAKQSPKPAEKDAIRPVGYRDLIACEEPECCADAMDSRPIRQMFAQIMTQFFLCAAANPDDHVCRATTLNQREKIWIAYFNFITRRDVHLRR